MMPQVLLFKNVFQDETNQSRSSTGAYFSAIRMFADCFAGSISGAAVFECNFQREINTPLKLQREIVAY